jgi:hypothetical protein
MSKCVKLDTKKYKSRDSPPYSAMDCKGAKLLGNDGQQYISKADKNGIYKWVKLAGKSESTSKIYSYYNGLGHIQHIYKVYPTENKVIVEILKDVQDENDRIIAGQITKKDYEKIINNIKILKTKVYNYDKIYFSKDLGQTWASFAIVIGKGNKYTNLMTTQKYNIKEPIETILFEVDGNWIPYTAIITKNHIYLSDYPDIEIVKDKEFNSAIDYHMNYWESRRKKKKVKCVKLEAKKYKTSDYPPYSATACKGEKLLGNDGQQYISKAYKYGIYKWVKIAEKGK